MNKGIAVALLSVFSFIPVSYGVVNPLFDFTFGSSGSGNGQFKNPEDLAIDSSDNIYVADTGNNRVQKFDSAGNYLSKFGSNGKGNGQFRAPAGIAIDSSGNIYVADTNNHRIQKFDSAGNYLSQFGSSGNGEGQFNVPQGVFVDDFGNIFVSDTGNHRIQKFLSDSTFVLSFGSSGTGNGQFRFPQQLDMNGLSGYVADTNNHRIYAFHFPPEPVADDQRIATLEETSVSLTLTASDASNDPLTYILVSDPSHGNLTGTAPGLIYHPDIDFFGTDSFIFKANDGVFDSNMATVEIDVGNINDPPVSSDQSVTTDEDVQKAVSVTANDPDGDDLQYFMVSGAQFGSISGTLPNIVYMPDLNFFGTDSFTFKANDGLVDSNTATVTVTVNAVNDPPVSYDVNVTINEDTPIRANDIPYPQSDVENDPLSLIIVMPLSHGTLSGEPTDLLYTPDPNYYGLDCLTFKVNDGEYDSNVSTACAIILPVNDPPLVNNTSVKTDEDTPRNVVLNATDIEDDSLTFYVTTPPSHGTISGVAPNLVYTPYPNYNGLDSIQYRAFDGNDYSNTATVSITVLPVNDAPVAYSMNFTTPEDIPFVNTQAVAYDVEDDALEYTLITGPSHGTLSGEPPYMTYTPDSDYFGPDSLTFKVNDGLADSNTATINMTVGPVDDHPVAYPQSITTDEDTELEIRVVATDADGDPLAYNMVSAPSHGTILGVLPNVTYSPAPNYFGPDSFLFKATDQNSDSSAATVSITVNPVNDPPQFDDIYVTMYEDTPIAFGDLDIVGSDPEGDPLTHIPVLPLSHITYSGSYPNFTMVPETNYFGSDLYEFKLNDGQADSELITAYFTILPVNDKPVADSQNISAEKNTLVYITLTGSDIEGDELEFAVVAPPAHGVLFGSEPYIRYLPNRNFVGEDQFTFWANDGNATSDPATISITVSDAPAEPTAQGSGGTSGTRTFDSIPRITDFSLQIDDSKPGIVSGEHRDGQSGLVTAHTYEKVKFSITLDDEEASSRITHFGLYTDIRRASSNVDNSNAYVLYDKGKPVTVFDKGGIFSDVHLDTSYQGRSMVVNVEIAFAKPMAASDVILEVWNEGRNPAYRTVVEVLQVVEEDDLEGPNISGSVTMPDREPDLPVQAFSTAEGRTTEIKPNGLVVLKNHDMSVRISGHLEGYPRGERVGIAIMRPDDTIYRTGAFLSEDGSYMVLTKLHTKWLSGFYEVLVDCMGKNEGRMRFFVTDKELAAGQFGAIVDQPAKLPQICQYLHGQMTREELVSYLSGIGWSDERIESLLANNKPVHVNPYWPIILGALVPLLYALVTFLGRGRSHKNEY